MTQITLDTSKGQLVPFVFGQDALAASQTDVQLPAVGPEEGGTVDGYCIPFPYDIVGVSTSLTVAGSAGSITVGATIDGTEDADTTLSITTGTNHYLRVPRGKASGAAGTRLGCELTTAAGWNGTTADLLAVVWCIVYMDGI